MRGRDFTTGLVSVGVHTTKLEERMEVTWEAHSRKVAHRERAVMIEHQLRLLVV